MLATLKLAQELGAQTATVAAPNPPPDSSNTRARTTSARSCWVGWPRGAGSSPWRDGQASRASALAPDLDVLVIARDRTEEARRRNRNPASPCDLWRRYGGALALSAATTLVAFPLSRSFELANIVMLFLLAVVGAALLFGRGPAVVAAIVNVLAFDFFFVPPRFSFAVSDVQYLFTFAVMLVVGLVVGQLTARLRYQARFAAQGEERARRLFEMARELSAALAPEQVAEIGERFVAAREPRQGRGADARGGRDAAASRRRCGTGIDMAIARWCVDHGEPAGIGTDTLPAAGKLYLPLKAPVRTRGVLVVEPDDAGQLMIPEQRRLLETCAALIAIALERVHFVTVAQRTLVDMESERLRNSVLSALSHDLRTPLTALVGLSETLAQELARGRRPSAAKRKRSRSATRRGAPRSSSTTCSRWRGSKRAASTCAGTGSRSRSSSAARSPRWRRRSRAGRSRSRFRRTCRSSPATAC